ncbi:MAG: MobC family plasmid mobilization relaxosome protein [Bdellovibrionota bacterium]
MTDDPSIELRQPDFRTNVRFTEHEYRRLIRDQAASGHSIPWLLKTAYFARGIAPPTLDPETRKAALRELRYIGNNLNQIAKKVNAGIVGSIRIEIAELLTLFRTLRSFLSRDFGDPVGPRDSKEAPGP